MIRRPPRSTLFPTRRSSDLLAEALAPPPVPGPGPSVPPRAPDRKSTRLNSSHVRISYAVFCLKKKKERQNLFTRPTLPPSTRPSSSCLTQLPLLFTLALHTS